MRRNNGDNSPTDNNVEEKSHPAMILLWKQVDLAFSHEFESEKP